MVWDKLADKQTVDKTILALKANGIKAYFVSNGEEAKKKMLELIPAGAQVMNNTSTTFDTISASKEILESSRFDALRNKLMKMDSNKEGRKMQEIGSAPEWTVGSVHAITQNGEIMVASASGSQLPGYAFGADHVVWIAGTHKIVKNIDEGFKRIYERSLALEDVRAQKVYGMHSSVNKILIINKESDPSRIHLILVDEALGF